MHLQIMSFISIFYFSYAVFNQPVSCESGHSFCLACIDQWKLTHSTCPVDRQRFTRPLIRNLAVEGVLKNRLIRCPSTATIPGCQWTGPVCSMEGHLRDCVMKVVECPFKPRGCVHRTYKGELEGHLASCPYRTVKCPFCSQEREVHEDVCEAKAVPCINACGNEVQRYCLLYVHVLWKVIQ